VKHDVLKQKDECEIAGCFNAEPAEGKCDPEKRKHNVLEIASWDECVKVGCFIPGRCESDAKMYPLKDELGGTCICKNCLKQYMQTAVNRDTVSPWIRTPYIHKKEVKFDHCREYLPVKLMEKFLSHQEQCIFLAKLLSERMRSCKGWIRCDGRLLGKQCLYGFVVRPNDMVAEKKSCEYCGNLQHVDPPVYEDVQALLKGSCSKSDLNDCSKPTTKAQWQAYKHKGKHENRCDGS